MSEASVQDPDFHAEDAAPLQRIQEALRGLLFGSVTLVVQDGVVVQIERIEKTRLRRATRRVDAQ